MTVGEVIDGTTLRSPIPALLEQSEVMGLDYDSRRVEKGFLFFAFAGQHHHGQQFAREAIERGALAVVSEATESEGFEGRWIEVVHGRRALALAARRFYGSQIDRLHLVGITGTNGKTTTSYIVDSILRAAGYTTALIGTVQYLLSGRPQPAVNTTPESVDLYRLLGELLRVGGTHVTMEVSSHALALGRVHGVPFHTAAFTNLTRDHLDFHGTMEDYFAAKSLLFQDRDCPPPAWAVLNHDDRWARSIRTAPGTKVLWYGLGDDAEVRALPVMADFGGLHFSVAWQGREYPVESPLLGAMNVYNILAAFGVGLCCGIPAEVVAQGVSACRSVPGRFERIDEGQPFLVVVDYAHTDDALRNVIAAARELSPGRIITVFGCGGDRDRTKRPLMGQAAGEGSDFVVLTSDNPRSEDPLAIITDALVGLRRQDVPHKIEADRAAAIRLALNEANAGDIVLITGKGHETYQVLKDKTIPFDDREVARRILRGYGYQGASK